jgi:site-specific DNA-cytosine methylase
MKQLTATHFIPLIGPFVAAADANDITTKKIFSFSAFKDNEQHIKPNYGYDVTYFPDVLVNPSIMEYKVWLKKLGHKPTDFMFCIPPCAGLSMMTSGADPKHRDKMNAWMYEAVKFFLASGCKLMMFENAFELTHKLGLVVVNNILKMLPPGYKMQIHKLTTLDHGLPQNRRRVFVFIYKSDEFIIPDPHKRTKVLWKTFLKRSEKPDGKNNHFLHPKIAEKYHKEMLQHGLYKILKDTANAHPRNNYSLFRLCIRDFEPGKLIKRKGSNLRKLLQKIHDLDHGCWDNSPNVCKNYTGAITKKNSLSMIHPRYDRTITFREMMDLMGLPDKFIIPDVYKNYNAICQNIPLPTVIDYVAAAVDLLHGSGRDIVSKERLIVVDDIKSRLGFLEHNEIKWYKMEEV